MNVASILTEKGRDVVTIKPEPTLSDGAKLMDEKRIGAVIVTAADGSIRGVLSERDITRQVARIGGGGALKQAVETAMTADVVTAEPGDTVDALMTKMTDRRIRHLPVVENGRLAGIVSIGDLVKRKIAAAEAEAEAMKAYISTG